MKVKFLQDFRGRETNERFYQAGDVVDIDPVDLVKRGICEKIVEPAPEVKEQRATVSPTKKGKSK